MSASQRRECCDKPVGSAPRGSNTTMKPQANAKIPGANTSPKGGGFAKIPGSNAKR